MVKKGRLDQRSGYYQTIAKFFIEERGAPFFLSSKELDIVSRWEKMNIPLRVILEGIKRSFERSRHRLRKRRKPYTLDYCHSFVLEAFKQYEERWVGQKKQDASGGRQGRERRILVEVEKFLEDIPEGLLLLKPVYTKLYKKLSGGKVTEEELEKAEETIERLIEESISAEQAETITAEILFEFGVKSGAKFDHIFRIKAVKAKRKKYQIPHVSPFYY